MKNNLISFGEAVNQIAAQLAAVSDTARLDAELLVAAAVDRSRSWLFAHLEETLTTEQRQQLQHLSTRRASGEPMAYILGYQEFWGLKFKVTPDVLVPRPETEHMIEWILTHFPSHCPLTIADLGTGSGAIALAIASERPAWKIDATDQSLSALTIAKQNAAHHQLHNVSFYLGNWCAALPKNKYTLLVSNPPYIAGNDLHLRQLTHEPLPALSPGPEGLEAIREIIAQAPQYLSDPGCLMLEHGYDQAVSVMRLLKQQEFTDVQSHHDLAHHPRFVTARYKGHP